MDIVGFGVTFSGELESAIRGLVRVGGVFGSFFSFGFWDLSFVMSEISYFMLWKYIRICVMPWHH
jgi:hypothetical protein